MFLLQLYKYFAHRPIFEHSVSGVGNLPSHVAIHLYNNDEVTSTMFLRHMPIFLLILLTNTERLIKMKNTLLRFITLLRLKGLLK